MEKHIKILGIIYIVTGFILIGVGALVAVILMVMSNDSGQQTPMGFTMVGGIVGGFVLLLSLPSIIGGFGLCARKQWARIVVIILGILSLANFPIGTGIGVYTLWALFHQDTQQLFT